MITQFDIAKRCGIDVSSVNKILRNVPGRVFRKETIRNVQRIAWELGYDFSRVKFAHRRRHPRREVNCEVRMTIYRPDGSAFSTGRATVCEVSLSGALLRGIVLANQVLPIDPHTIGLGFLAGPGLALEVRGLPVRYFQDGDKLGLSVEFVQSAGVEKWIRMIS